MNREIPEGILEELDLEHRRRLWWTVYILDRKLSINMGAPLSGLRDEDMDLSLPNTGVYRGPCPELSLHIKITKLTGNVMMGKLCTLIVPVSLYRCLIILAAYRLHKTLNMTFLRGIQDVFSDMAKLAEECSGIFSLDLDNPNTISRSAASLHLSYYQVLHSVLVVLH
jgi:proline utilization trans-activator